MKKLDAKGMKFLWLIHIILMVAWMGAILCYLLILLSVNKAGESAVYGAYASIHAIDLYLIRNGALGLVLTGILYGVFTNWGFFRYKWVTIKWVTMILQIVLGAVYLGSHLDANIKMIEASTGRILSNPEFIRNQNTLIVGCIVQLTILLFVILISKFKPWSKKIQR